jgi:NAD-dependent deacetylase
MLAAQEATIRKARPNPAHMALARLERLGVLYGIITQNVDSLHHEAGSACVVELHGSFRRLVCTSTLCDQVLDASRRPDLGLPICNCCGRVLKPDVTLFGEQLDENTLTAARQLTRTCGVMLVIGTSAAVPPAAAFPQLASAGGALVVEFNIEPTAITDWCEVTILGDAAETLPKLTDRVGELMSETSATSS